MDVKYNALFTLVRYLRLLPCYLSLARLSALPSVCGVDVIKLFILRYTRTQHLDLSCTLSIPYSYNITYRSHHDSS